MFYGLRCAADCISRELGNDLDLPDDGLVESLKVFGWYPVLLMITTSGLPDWITSQEIRGNA